MRLEEGKRTNVIVGLCVFLSLSGNEGNAVAEKLKKVRKFRVSSRERQWRKERGERSNGESAGESGAVDQVEGEIVEEIEEAVREDGQELERQGRDSEPAGAEAHRQDAQRRRSAGEEKRLLNRDFTECFSSDQVNTSHLPRTSQRSDARSRTFSVQPCRFSVSIFPFRNLN
ncbi:hypothetical protein H6P81_020786 [Aristolochia fimbriata]|uniref:Uncharacterized protein n=1 Tax=Aristolochia fimbriata TaxID=158543 RepID=A0AAV7DYL5_ARIFI|nr:hypothetical protein H6P81_020786 [Aristolochia fimbriata]